MSQQTTVIAEVRGTFDPSWDAYHLIGLTDTEVREVRQSGKEVEAPAVDVFIRHGAAQRLADDLYNAGFVPSRAKDRTDELAHLRKLLDRVLPSALRRPEGDE